jgi:hypothetical protein
MKVEKVRTNVPKSGEGVHQIPKQCENQKAHSFDQKKRDPFSRVDRIATKKVSISGQLKQGHVIGASWDVYPREQEVGTL